MKIFVAGASGALGVPLVKELLRQGHQVTAMCRSAAGIQKLKSLGVDVAQVDALDAEGVRKAVQRSSPEAVIDQLTSLPKNPADLPKAAAQDREVRLVGGGYLFSAAIVAGAKRYVLQSSGFFLKPRDGGLATEQDSFQVDATPNISRGAQMYRSLEERVFGDPHLKGIALRYGFLYGSGTWYSYDGGAADLLQQQALPLIGSGAAINSFIHVEDAAAATVVALHAEPGVYNIVDDDPVPVAKWLPAFAESVGAPAPPRMTEAEALVVAGPDAVFYHNGLSGACNDKAKAILEFRPRRLEWLHRT
jgi:2-alkyl-3-oxoalkanoate reductase